MTKRTRPELERLDFELKLDRERANSLLKTIGSLVILSGVGGGLANATGRDWLQPALNGAGNAMLVALVGFSAIGAVIAVTHMFTRHKLVWVEGDGTQFAQTGERTLTRLPDGVTEIAVWRYLIGVANERHGLSQRGAAEYDMTQEQSNDVKDWLVQRGWIEITNPSNGHWDWTETGERVRDLLRERPPANWNRIVREVQS